MAFQEIRGALSKLKEFLGDSGSLRLLGCISRGIRGISGKFKVASESVRKEPRGA